MLQVLQVLAWSRCAGSHSSSLPSPTAAFPSSRTRMRILPTLALLSMYSCAACSSCRANSRSTMMLRDAQSARSPAAQEPANESGTAAALRTAAPPPRTWTPAQPTCAAQDRPVRARHVSPESAPRCRRAHLVCQRPRAQRRSLQPESRRSHEHRGVHRRLLQGWRRRPRQRAPDALAQQRRKQRAVNMRPAQQAVQHPAAIHRQGASILLPVLPTCAAAERAA